MAPEAPADTAGPSSPPPQLPEGWLPQWEGVRRQWYYVQRTTGKSQWSIPTEPIYLTPSTTPSIGGGPSQAPQQPNNSTQGVESGDHIADATYPVADSAGISSSLNPQIYAPSQSPLHGTGIPNWHSTQTGQHMPGGYEPSQTKGTNGQMNGVQPAIYANQTPPGYPYSVAHNISPSPLGHNENESPGKITAYNMINHPHSFQGYPPTHAAAMHGYQPPASWAVTQADQINRAMTGAIAHHPQWTEDHPGHMPTSVDGSHSFTLPQTFYGSYSSPYHAEQSSREYASRASGLSFHQEAQQYQPHPNSALHGLSPLQQAQTQYHQQYMIPTHPRPGAPHTWSGEQEGHQHQSLAQYPTVHGGPARFYGSANVHQMPYSSSHYQSPEEPTRASGSQFISGPWTSTPASRPL